MTLVDVTCHIRPTCATLYVIDTLGDSQVVSVSMAWSLNVLGLSATHSHNLSIAMPYPRHLSKSAFIIQQGQNKVDLICKVFTLSLTCMLSMFTAGISNIDIVARAGHFLHILDRH